MKYKLFTLLTPMILLGSSTGVLAQREAPTRGERREARQQANENLTPEQRTQNFQERWNERFKAASPEQQQRMTEMRNRMNERMREAGVDPADPNAFQKMQEAGGFGGRPGGGPGGPQTGAPGEGAGGEQRTAPAPAPILSKEDLRRQLMNTAGITDRNVQFAILAFANRQDTARENLLKLAQEAAIALSPAPEVAVPAVVEARVGGAGPVVVDATPAVTTDAAQVAAVAPEDKFASAMEKYQDAIAKDRVRYTAALKTLDKEIKYSSNPRLHGFLTLAGILEFDPLAFGGAAAIFAPVMQANAEAQVKAEREAAERARQAAVAVQARAEALEASLPAGFGGSRRSAVINAAATAQVQTPAPVEGAVEAGTPAAEDKPAPVPGTVIPGTDTPAG